MMSHGHKGYRDNAQTIIDAVNYLKKSISEIPELEVIGDPQVNLDFCIINFYSYSKKKMIFKYDYMNKEL